MIDSVALAHAAKAIVAVAGAATGDTTLFRGVTDGGIIAVLGVALRAVFILGQLKQMVIGHDRDIERLKDNEDAERIANFEGYRARNRRTP
jgi:hypothetical protein